MEKCLLSQFAVRLSGTNFATRSTPHAVSNMTLSLSSHLLAQILETMSEPADGSAPVAVDPAVLEDLVKQITEAASAVRTLKEKVMFLSYRKFLLIPRIIE